MNVRPEITAVVFDMDGVLIDSSPCHRSAFQEVFLRYGIADFSYEQYAGWKTTDVVQHVLGSAVPNITREQIGQIAAEKSNIAREKMRTIDPTVPGCPRVLRQLFERYLLGLASSGSRASVELFLTMSGCRDLFRCVLCGDEVERAKPDPEIYLRTFASLDVASARAAVIEDAVAGIKAARAAGAGKVIGIAGTVPAAELEAAGADHVVNSITELPDLLCERHEAVRSH